MDAVKISREKAKGGKCGITDIFLNYSVAPPDIFHHGGQMGPLKFLQWHTNTQKAQVNFRNSAMLLHIVSLKKNSGLPIYLGFLFYI